MPFSPILPVFRSSLAHCAAFSLLGGLACAAPVGAQSLAPPPGNTLFLHTFGNGIQIYHSQSVGGTLRWVFFAPSATLYANSSEAVAVATHYTGPTWQLNDDGSRVVGKMLVSAPSATLGSIPQLLLAAKSHTGPGVFGRVSFVQRLDTVGGSAPAAAPTALGQEADVPYKATYNFFFASAGR
jgi:hypothetical protein